MEEARTLERIKGATRMSPESGPETGLCSGWPVLDSVDAELRGWSGYERVEGLEDCRCAPGEMR